jgi:hypothetical protein
LEIDKVYGSGDVVVLGAVVVDSREPVEPGEGDLGDGAICVGEAVFGRKKLFKPLNI